MRITQLLLPVAAATALAAFGCAGDRTPTPAAPQMQSQASLAPTQPYGQETGSYGEQPAGQSAQPGQYQAGQQQQPSQYGQEQTGQTGQQAMSDEQLHDQIHQALEQASGIDASNIKVTVEGGVVRLEGEVKSEQERTQAHEVAHRVPGVTNVYVNNLQVR